MPASSVKLTSKQKEMLYVMLDHCQSPAYHFESYLEFGPLKPWSFQVYSNLMAILDAQFGANNVFVKKACQFKPDYHTMHWVTLELAKSLDVDALRKMLGNYKPEYYAAK